MRRGSEDSVLSASLILLNVVNRSVQTSAAPLFICRSYVSGRTRLWRGERLTIWCWRRAPSQNVCACFCQPGYQPERTQPHKILSLSGLKTMNNKWVHFKAPLTLFTGQETKAGSSGSFHTDALFHSTKLWLFVCFWKRDHRIHYLKCICFWKCSSMIRIIHDEDSYV